MITIYAHSWEDLLGSLVGSIIQSISRYRYTIRPVERRAIPPPGARIILIRAAGDDNRILRRGERLTHPWRQRLDMTILCLPSSPGMATGTKVNCTI